MYFYILAKFNDIDLVNFYLKRLITSYKYLRFIFKIDSLITYMTHAITKNITKLKEFTEYHIAIFNNRLGKHKGEAKNCSFSRLFIHYPYDI